MALKVHKARAGKRLDHGLAKRSSSLDSEQRHFEIVTLALPVTRVFASRRNAHRQHFVAAQQARQHALRLATTSMTGKRFMISWPEHAQLHLGETQAGEAVDAEARAADCAFSFCILVENRAAFD